MSIAAARRVASSARALETEQGEEDEEGSQ
jgi:hypothetical protein